jgi:hypothetical protein
VTNRLRPVRMLPAARPAGMPVSVTETTVPTGHCAAIRAGCSIAFAGREPAGTRGRGRAVMAGDSVMMPNPIPPDRLERTGHSAEPFDLDDADAIPEWIRGVVGRTGPLGGLAYGASWHPAHPAAQRVAVDLSGVRSRGRPAGPRGSPRIPPAAAPCQTGRAPAMLECDLFLAHSLGSRLPIGVAPMRFR